MNIKFLATLLVACVLVAPAAATAAKADDAFAELRTGLAKVVAACPAGPTQRACIYDLQKADTLLFDAANPPRDEKERAFRACTTATALEMQTQYVVDMLQLNENQWSTRTAALQQEAEANWTRCTVK